VLEQMQKNRYDHEELKRAEAAVSPAALRASRRSSARDSSTSGSAAAGSALTPSPGLAIKFIPGDLLAHRRYPQILVRVYVDEPEPSGA